MHRKFFCCFYPLVFFVSPAAAQRIGIVPITLREGKDYASFQVFSQNAEAAKRAEVDLTSELDKFVAQGYRNHNAFLLFYNFVQANGCGRDYVIQTVKLTKKFYDRNGRVYQEENQYLVEVMRLDRKRWTRKPDQHLKRYSLENAHRRDLFATYEVGCGKIPGVVDGNPWPFKPSKNYRRLQNYSNFPGLYERVKFDFSRSYSLGLSFDADGKFTVQLPDFLARQSSGERAW